MLLISSIFEFGVFGGSDDTDEVEGEAGDSIGDEEKDGPDDGSFSISLSFKERGVEISLVLI